MSRNAINTIALSFAPDHPSQAKLESIERAAAALAAFGETMIFRLQFGANTIVLTTCPENQIAVRAKAGLVLHGTHALSREGEAVDAAGMLARFKGDDAASFNAFEPPYLVFAGSRNAVIACSDAAGLGLLYSCKDDGCVCVATSATLMARVFGCRFNIDGIFQNMTAGHRLSRTTAFDGVEMVPAGVCISLEEGMLSLDASAARHAHTLHDPVEEGREAVVGAVSHCLRADPDCAIELSGGMDCRVILAAIPKNLRSGRKAYTIGYEGTPDVKIARDIAATCDLDHVFIDLAQFEGESLDTTWKRARRIAYRHDFANNVLDRLTIDCVDDILLNRARLSGLNGELARGFYYPAFPIEGPVTENAIDRLIAWRLTANDAVPRELFDPAALVACTANFREIVGAELRAGPPPLGNALDLFFLDHLTRYVTGNAVTRSMPHRMVLMPFFHSGFIGWAMGLPVNQKNDSRAFSAVLTALDPALAGMALDTNLIPGQLAGGGVGASLALLRAKGVKLSRKIMQRLAGARQASLGATRIQTRLCRGEIVEQLDWTRLEATGLFDPGGLKKLRDGTIPWNKVTLGNMFALHFQLDYLARPAGGERFQIVDLM